MHTCAGCRGPVYFLTLVFSQEHRLHLGQNAIYHLEAFVAKFMAMYKKFIIDMCGGGF